MSLWHLFQLHQVQGPQPGDGCHVPKGKQVPKILFQASGKKLLKVILSLNLKVRLKKVARDRIWCHRGAET